MMKKNNFKYVLSLKQHLFYVLVIGLSILFTYWGLWDSYFEQDEWYVFGEYNILLSLKGLEFFTNLLTSNFPFHFTPLSTIFKMGLYRIFALNAAPYFIVSIFIHFLVSVSLYFLILIFTKKKFPAFLGALFFAINSSHYQAVTWIGTFEGVELSILFGILSLLSYHLYFKKKQLKCLLLTSVLLLVSLLFKETALVFLMALFIIIPFGNRMNSSFCLGTIKRVMPIFSVFILYILLRFSYILFDTKETSVSSIQTGDDFILKLGYNFLTSVIKIFAQIFFPNELLVYLSNVTTSPLNIYQYLARGPWVIENGFRYDLLTVLLGFIIMVLIFLVSRQIKNKQPLFLGLGIIIFTILPLLVIGKYLTFLDSRYLYPATIGVSLIIGWLSWCLICAGNRIIKDAGLLLLVVILSSHLFTLKDTTNKIIALGQIRQSVINKIMNTYPRLTAKTVFYVSSDSSFYGSGNEKIMPFQSGFGQLLLVVYYPTEAFAVNFFKDDFLWNLTDQGYKEFESRGFGYFRDMDKLQKTLKENNLSPSSVISYEFFGSSNTLKDTTTEMRKKLK